MKININQEFDEFSETPAKAGKIFKTAEAEKKQTKRQAKRRRAEIKEINRKCRHGKQNKYHNGDPCYYDF